MGKAPATQWFFKDWLSDVELQKSSSSTRGIWSNALAFMWQAKERGKISGDKDMLVRMLNSNTVEFELFILEADENKFCDIERIKNNHGNEIMTITNRRMFREEKEKKLHRERQLRYKERKSNTPADAKDDDKMTPPSPSASPFPTANNKKKRSKSHCEDPPNPHVKEFIDFYFQEFKKRFEYPPIIQGGKDGQLVKSLLKKIDLDELKILLVTFLDSKDPWILNSGYTLGAFYSQINKLRIGQRSFGKTFEAGQLWLKAKEIQNEKAGRKEIPKGSIENKGIPPGDEPDRGGGGH